MAPFGHSHGLSHHEPLRPYRREDYRPHEFEHGSLQGESIDGREARQTAWSAGPQGEVQPLPVVDLHPSNFNRIVLDPARTVIVAFYAPWCKAVEVETLLTELQHDLAGEFDIVLGRVDADMYKDIFAHFNGTTLPAIFLFPMNEKRGMEYTGNRNKEALIEHIIFHHRGEKVHVPRGRRRGPKRGDFPGAPAPVDAPPKKEDYPEHPYEFYIPPPPPAAPEVEALLHQPPHPPHLQPRPNEYPQPYAAPYQGNWGPYSGSQPQSYPPVMGQSMARRSSHPSYTRPPSAPTHQAHMATPSAPYYSPMSTSVVGPPSANYPQPFPQPYPTAPSYTGFPVAPAAPYTGNPSPYQASVPPPYVSNPMPFMQPQGAMQF